ncbi:peroxisomal membrane anchor protein conserved region-domain-containing protein [Mycotypha africana]|uniref:peroxisomal membrane anchor protein conserved region-domain-containing protein n=1 Tax=Mycotypha africana TaxID=64632 RepID=UPI0023009ECC|nr:peroxisomal membrane anchor protein conserved region-domain-containing protein [Mycotypha africana]KAI8991998.1 peroxisomal membrane anchor protein conserved region-domain-containing protein [Mycotypha africana]
MSNSSSSSLVKNLINELSNTSPSTTTINETPASTTVEKQAPALEDNNSTSTKSNPSTAATSPIPQTSSNTNTNSTISTAEANANTDNNSNTAPLREDMIKQAVSFLSSLKVRSADKDKKIAFLRNKGLTQAEIDESFKRVDSGNTVPSTSNLENMATPTTTTTAVSSQQQRPPLPPVLPPRAYTQPQIVYYPLPSPPPVPTERVFALAMMMGMGAVGATAGIIGLLKQFIGPIFNRIADYQRTRYVQRREMADKLLDLLTAFNTENDDLDALIDQGEEKTVSDALIKSQTELPIKLDTLRTTLKDRITALFNEKQKPYNALIANIDSFKDTLATHTSGVDLSSSNTYSYTPYYMRHNSNMDSPALSGLKSDIRSLKAVLLNRRNFPTV